MIVKLFKECFDGKWWNTTESTTLRWKFLMKKLKSCKTIFIIKTRCYCIVQNLPFFPCFLSSSSIRNKTDFRLFWFFLVSLTSFLFFARNIYRDTTYNENSKMENITVLNGLKKVQIDPPKTFHFFKKLIKLLWKIFEDSHLLYCWFATRSIDNCFNFVLITKIK